MLGIAGLSAYAAEADKPVITYEEFGAIGDGETDDFDAIVQAHAHANERQLPVRAKDSATYYIGGKDQTAIIQTDTDFGKAKFLIDDRDLENITAHVFEVRSAHEPIPLEGLTSLRRNQAKLDLELPGPSVVALQDHNVMRFIRRGGNQND